MISQKDQLKYKAKLNKKYGFRKFITTITLFLLVCYIALIIATFFVSGGIENSPLDVTSEIPWIFGLHLTPYGFSMLVVGVILFIMQIISIIFTLTSITPRKASKMQREISAAQHEKRVKNKIYNEWKNKNISNKKTKKSKKSR